MRVGLIGRTLIGTAILALLVSGLLIALILAVDGEQDAARKARRSREAIATADLVERRVLDVENSVRGYLLAGDDRELARWRSARVALPRFADSLVSQLADDPRQAARARAIRADVAVYLDDYAAPVIARAQRAGVGSGRALRDSLQGGARSDSLSRRLATLGLAATAAADARQADADAGA